MASCLAGADKLVDYLCDLCSALPSTWPGFACLMHNLRPPWAHTQRWHYTKLTSTLRAATQSQCR